MHRGVVVLAGQHLDRLFEGAKALDMDPAITKQGLLNLVRRQRGFLEGTGSVKGAKWTAAAEGGERFDCGGREQACNRAKGPRWKAACRLLRGPRPPCGAQVYQTLDANGMGAATGVHIRLMVGAAWCTGWTRGRPAHAIAPPPLAWTAGNVQVVAFQGCGAAAAAAGAAATCVARCASKTVRPTHTRAMLPVNLPADDAGPQVQALPGGLL